MKSVINILGIVLIILGIVSFAYKGITYTKKEQVAEIAGLQVTADTQKTIHLPPLVGGVSIAAGLFLLIIGRLRGK
ncbi:MAG: DUF3185 domain-containing protein [Gammaproteobacteria bacterium]|nr:DUF3185 domain-containing protein [Gammaproteobacteria bacterium]